MSLQLEETQCDLQNSQKDVGRYEVVMKLQMRTGVETQAEEPSQSCAICGVPVSCPPNSEGQGSADGGCRRNGRTDISSGFITAGNGIGRWRAVPPKYR